jgi:rubrerythrin
MRRFQKLLRNAVLEKAIQFEEKAYRYYEHALQMSTMVESFDVLKELMADELKHRMMLQEALRSGELRRVGGEEYTVSAGVVSDICREWPSIEPRRGIRHVLENALSLERCAALFYQKMHDRTENEVLKKTFSALLSAERRHIARISERLEREP